MYLNFINVSRSNIKQKWDAIPDRCSTWIRQLWEWSIHGLVSLVLMWYYWSYIYWNDKISHVSTRFDQAVTHFIFKAHFKMKWALICLSTLEDWPEGHNSLNFSHEFWFLPVTHKYRKACMHWKYFLGQGFSNGSLRAKYGSPTLHAWPLVSFNIHRNILGSDVYLAPGHLSLNSLWPFMASREI